MIISKINKSGLILFDKKLKSDLFTFAPKYNKLPRLISQKRAVVKKYAAD